MIFGSLSLRVVLVRAYRNVRNIVITFSRIFYVPPVIDFHAWISIITSTHKPRFFNLIVTEQWCSSECRLRQSNSHWDICILYCNPVVILRAHRVLNTRNVRYSVTAEVMLMGNIFVSPIQGLRGIQCCYQQAKATHRMNSPSHVCTTAAVS